MRGFTSPRRLPRATACSFLVLAMAAGAARADDAAPPSGDSSGDIQNITVTADHLNQAREGLETKIGATVYKLSDQSISDQPGGADIPLNQTLLQAPGVSQDSYGQIHLRNDHGNIQYRIDGVILPEGISFFGQSLTSRFASSIDLITGSLPAQYGLVTTGIVDIKTKSGAFDQGGSVGIYGGSNGWVEPSLEYSGSSGNFRYYVAGDFTQNQIGVENPTSSDHPIHDQTQQAHGFALLDDIIDSDNKVSAILGYYQGSFQIPDNPGQTPSFQLGNQTAFNSANLNEHQLETNDYAVLSYLHATDNFDFQLSAFARYSKLAYSPDGVGDLMFYGLAHTAFRGDVAEGMQGDSTYRLSDDHTLRFGGLFTAEHAYAATDSSVLPCADATCVSVGTSPVSVVEGSSKTGFTYSAYLQDEWKVSSQVTVNYGFRYDMLDAYTANGQVSPRFNVVWKPDDDTALHAGYSRYFTPPSMELVSGGSLAKFANTTGYPAGYSPSSPPADGPILPERSNYYDVGVERTFLPGLKIGLDAYAKIAQDLIDEGQFGSPIILAVFNYSRANVYGAELSTSYEQDNWSIYANLSGGREKAADIVSQQYNFSPADLAYIANHYIYTDHNQWVTASGGVSYSLFGTRLSADVIYGTGLREDSDIPNGATVAPYAQINLGISHKFDETPMGLPLEWSAAILNVTDRDYLIRSGNGVGVFAPQYGPRRAIYSGLRAFF